MSLEPVKRKRRSPWEHLMEASKFAEIGSSARRFAVVVAMAVAALQAWECMAQTCAPPPAGLVSWWRGEGDAADQAGANGGTLVGNTGFDTGRVGQGFVFDGSGDAVQLGNPASLRLQDFTIE